MARRAPISSTRNTASFSRAQGKKAPRSITLIVCEGETEQIYFAGVRQKFALTTAEVVLPTNNVGPAPISVVDCAIEKAGERGGYDHIFCVIDRDGHESFDRARQKIKEHATLEEAPLPIKEAISIPCFEYWVLLHFEQTDSPFTNCDQAIGRVRHAHVPGYVKADAAVVKTLMPRLDTAIANAVWAESRAEVDGFNPYTSVHNVIVHLKSVAQPSSPA